MRTAVNNVARFGIVSSRRVTRAKPEIAHTTVVVDREVAVVVDSCVVDVVDDAVDVVVDAREVDVVDDDAVALVVVAAMVDEDEGTPLVGVTLVVGVTTPSSLEQLAATKPIDSTIAAPHRCLMGRCSTRSCAPARAERPRAASSWSACGKCATIRAMVTITTTAAGFGAYVEGVDYSVAPDDTTRAAVHAALDDQLVLIFRGRPTVPTDAQVVAFCSAFGPLRPSLAQASPKGAPAQPPAQVQPRCPARLTAPQTE